jgi:hypothetical protein
MVMMIGDAMLTCKSVKQRLVTRSSAEAEFIALSDMASDIVFTRLTCTQLDAGLFHGPMKVMEDNEACINLVNGAEEASHRTKHINIRRNWIVQEVEARHIVVEYCPTDGMIADFFTKPMVGEKFKYFRSVIMGHPMPGNTSAPIVPIGLANVSGRKRAAENELDRED